MGCAARLPVRAAKIRWQSSGGFVRETYRLSRGQTREKAREWFYRWPKAAYWTEDRKLAGRTGEGDTIEFTMRRLPTAD